ncbi:hypothetical protein ACLCDV_11075 [Sphingobacterium sp. Lzh-3]|uniref:hypothetical protein n=1 Tax=Sphingobacterium sp. Lzh-3 TaxID=3382150 RepID=UPI00398CEC69
MMLILNKVKITFIAMVTKRNKSLKIGVYSLGILLYAIWINMGSAIDHLSVRWHRPNTFFFIGATVGLLVLYAYFIAWMLHWVYAARSTIIQVFNHRLLRYRALLFLGLTLGLLTAVHLLLMTAVLSQHRGYTIFNSYFKHDFWVFFVPLLLYCIYLYRHPQLALSTFKRLGQLEDCKEELELRQQDLIAQRGSLLNANADLRRQERNLQEQMEQLLQKQGELSEVIRELKADSNGPALPDSALLKVWQEQRSMPALLAYIRSLQVAGIPADRSILQVHQVVFLYRKNRVFFIGDKDGDKQMISDRAGQVLIASEWLVKVSNTYYINMLYCYSQLQKYEGADEKEGAKMLLLDPAVRASIEAQLPASELNAMLKVTRRSRERFYAFWEYSKLLTLDENGLFLKFRIKGDQLSAS